jgi:hypothetical protein
MADHVELEARISAMELVLATHLLQSGLSSPEFDPRAFAISRRDAWIAVGNAACQSCTSDEDEKRFVESYAASLERLGHLLVALAEPVQEAIDEVLEMNSGERSSTAAAQPAGA